MDDGTPSCSSIKVGVTLPKNYEGCQDGSDLVPALVYDCDDGSKLYVLADGGARWAKDGGKVREGGYDAAFAACKP